MDALGATLLHGPPGGAWNWLGVGSSTLTSETQIAVQAEPKIDPDWILLAKSGRIWQEGSPLPRGLDCLAPIPFS